MSPSTKWHPPRHHLLGAEGSRRGRTSPSLARSPARRSHVFSRQSRFAVERFRFRSGRGGAALSCGCHRYWERAGTEGRAASRVSAAGGEEVSCWGNPMRV